MDLNFVKDQLETFETFGKAIGDFLKIPAQLLGNAFGWFTEGTLFGTGNVAQGVTAKGDYEETKNVFSSK
ncbi:MAG: PorH family porin [Corynebacterium sp.]|nr:PorH family porin [Corynebacterium sp.]